MNEKSNPNSRIKVNKQADTDPSSVDIGSRLVVPEFPSVSLSHQNMLLFLRNINQIELIKRNPHLLRLQSDFSYLKVIGEGGFSQVWLASDLRAGRHCAVKELYLEDFSERQLLTYVREIQTMSLVHSKYVVNLIGFTASPPFAIITEYISGGCLHDFIHKKSLQPTHETIIALCIARGMMAIHNAGIMHRDLKSLNVLLDPNGIPKICDFGIARTFRNQRNFTINLGTPSNVAPEILNNPNYGPSSDVYSYALTLVEMINRHNPYFPMYKTTEEIVEYVSKGGRPKLASKRVNSAFEKLISRCWDADPSKRPTFEEIFNEIGSGKCYFQGTDINTVKDYAEKIMTQETQEYTPPPYFQSNVISAISRLEKQNEKIKNRGIKKALKVQESNNDKSIEENKISRRMAKRLSRISVSRRSCLNLDIDMNRIMTKENYELLKHPEDPRFCANFLNIALSVEPSSFHELYRPIVQYLFDNSNPELINIIIESLIIISSQNGGFYQEFNGFKLFTVLPLCLKSLELLSQMINFSSELIDPQQFRLLAFGLMSFRDLTLAIFSKVFSGKFRKQHISHSTAILDLFLKYAQQFISELNPDATTEQTLKFLDIICCTINDYFKAVISCYNEVISVLTVFMKTSNSKISYHCIRILSTLLEKLNNPEICEFEDKDIMKDKLEKRISFYAIYRAILDENGISVALSFLLRTSHFPSLETNNTWKEVTLTLDSLLSISTSKSIYAKSILILIMKLLNNESILLESKESNVNSKPDINNNSIQKYLVKQTAWMECSVQNIDYAYKIFLFLFAKKENRKELVFANYFCHFITKVASSGSLDCVESLSTIFKRIVLLLDNDMKKIFLDSIANSLFISSYIQRMNKDAQKMHGSYLPMMESLFSFGFVNGMENFIPILGHTLENRNSMTKMAIQLLSQLSYFQPAAVIIKGSPIEEYFSQLQNTSYKKYAIALLENIKKIQ